MDTNLESLIYDNVSNIAARNELLVAVRRDAARVAALEAFVREALMNCSIDNHGGGEDLSCEFCAKGGALLLGEG